MYLTYTVGGGSGIDSRVGEVGTVFRGSRGIGGGDVRLGWRVLTLGTNCGKMGDENSRKNCQTNDQQLPSTAVTVFGH